MNNLIKQFSGLLGTGFAAACCLGLPVILSAIGAAGLGFIVKDAYLMPIFAAFVFFTLWQLNSACNRHADMRPFYLSAAMGLLAIIFMFLMVTGLYANTTLLYLSLSGLVAGSIWDIVNSRKQTTCETACTTDPVDPQKRKLNGAVLAVASAGVFYGLYKTVDTMAPSAQKDDIKCWGANSCKGTTACGTAFNACTGQNSCKGKGWSFMPESVCYTKGGVRFEGSEGDPAAKKS